MKGYSVREVEAKELHHLILEKHYAKRLPSISFAWGLYDSQDSLVGGLTIGKPASAPLCVGVCGKENSKKVYELNRLILLPGLPQNTSSFFVGKALKSLKSKDLVIVSYSDTGMGHTGYTYQATNFIYTGLTVSRTDKYTPPGTHSRHYDDSSPHLRKVRTSKHRYVFFTNKRNRALRDSLKYPVLPYPKGDNSYYSLGEGQKTMILDKTTGESWWE